jgi:KTSC domain
MTDPTPPLPDIPLTPVRSSNVTAIGYDPATQTARVQFKGGATYRYAGVSPKLFESIQKSESVGAAVSRLRRLPTTREL